MNDNGLNESSEVEQVSPTDEEIKVKILHQLGIYPIISPTMLQGALGPQLKPALWRPVLAKLIQDEIVVEEMETLLTPADRYNTYTKLSLMEAINAK